MVEPVQNSKTADTRYKILVDADILEEAILNRGSFVESAEQLFEALHFSFIHFYVTERGMNQIRYNYDETTAEFFRSWFKERVINIDESIKEKARYLNFADYESAIEYVCAKEMCFDAIMTLNPSNFAKASLPIWEVADLAQRISLEQSLQNVQERISDISRNSLGNIDRCDHPSRYDDLDNNISRYESLGSIKVYALGKLSNHRIKNNKLRSISLLDPTPLVKKVHEVYDSCRSNLLQLCFRQFYLAGAV